MSAAGPLWTLARLAESMRGFFASKAIATARLDAELLLAHVLKKPRIYLYTHHDQPITDAERDALRALAKRRAAHEPMAYILGEQEFYGLAFEVTPAVLIPRPETEQLVDVAIAYLRALPPGAKVIDIGTGSGAIAVALAQQVPSACVIAVDKSREALAIAARNAARHGAEGRVHFVCADMADIAQGRVEEIWDAAPFDLVLSNPPYIGTDERSTLPADVVHYEPPLALFSDEDGRTMLSQVADTAPRLLAAQGLLAMEIGPRHASWLRQVPLKLTDRRIDRDLAGHERLFVAWRGDWPTSRLPARTASAAPAAETPVETQLEAPDIARD